MLEGDWPGTAFLDAYAAASRKRSQEQSIDRAYISPLVVCSFGFLASANASFPVKNLYVMELRRSPQLLLAEPHRLLKLA